MFKKTLLAAGSLALIAGLSACEGGQGRNDTLIDGATDRPTDNNAASGNDVGPASPPTGSASPAMGNSAGQPGASQTANGPTLAIAGQGSQRPYIVDSAGNALYYAEGDRDGTKCVGDCVQAWPPVVVSGIQPSGAAGLQGAMIATIARPEGGTQVTFNGHPLYRYAADAGASSTNGDGVKDKFATWRLATPTMAGASGQQGPSGSTASPQQQRTGTPQPSAAPPSARVGGQ